MSRRSDRRLWRASALGVALYAVFLLTAHFEHHDLIGHVKTLFHCTSCTSSVLGSDPHPPTVFDGGHLADAGRAIVPEPLAHGCLPPSRTTGRSPPTA